MKTKKISRRAALAGGLVFAPAAAVAAVPTAIGDDPIYAAIERHRVAADVLHAVCHGDDTTDDDIYAAAKTAFAAAAALARTEPTTLPGVRAALEYACKLDPDGMPEDFDRVLPGSLRATLRAVFPT